MTKKLRITIQVDGRPLRRMYVEHLRGFAGNKMYMTNEHGVVAGENGQAGLFSDSDKADIRIHCQNSVVKVLDGNGLGAPSDVNKDVNVSNHEVVNITGRVKHRDHYRILNRCLIAYEVIFRQFQPFTFARRRDFPLLRNSSLQASKDQRERIEVSYPSQFPMGDVAFTEPSTIATGYPLVHFRRRANPRDSAQMRAERGRLFGEDNAPPTLIPSELSHALHFSRFGDLGRTRIETAYIGFISSNIASGGDGRHAPNRHTTPEVAFIEALDIFAAHYAEYVRVDLQVGGSRYMEPHAHSATIRAQFVSREPAEEANLIVPSDNDTRIFAPDPANPGVFVPNQQGADCEGAVYGCIFVDFASRVGLKTAVDAYFRSAEEGVLTIDEYRNWIKRHRRAHLKDLDRARKNWGL